MNIRPKQLFLAALAVIAVLALSACVYSTSEVQVGQGQSISGPSASPSPEPQCALRSLDAGTAGDATTVAPGSAVGLVLTAYGAQGLELSRLEGAPVVARWAAEGVDPADWSTRFTGYVVSKRAGSDRTATRSRAGWRTAGCRGRSARASRPTCGPRLETQAEGSAGETVLGRRAPVAYGTCDSTGLGSHGLRKLLFVQTAGAPWRWLYSVGDCAVDAAFVDGEPVATGWTRVVEFRGGWWWTTVDFAEDPRPEDGNGGRKAVVLTADGDGLDVGTFGADTSPAAQLRHALEAFGQGWDGSAGVTDQLTDDASWAALEAAPGRRTGACRSRRGRLVLGHTPLSAGQGRGAGARRALAARCSKGQMRWMNAFAS